MGDVGFAGSLGWYDYSFAQASLGIPRRFYEAKVSPGVAERLGEFVEQDAVGGEADGGDPRGAGRVAHEIHENTFYVLALLFALHLAGALKHHFIDKDPTLARMTPGLDPPAQDPT